MCAHVRVGKWGRSVEKGHTEVSWSYRRKCHYQVGSLCPIRFELLCENTINVHKNESLCFMLNLFLSLRFLLKNNKAQEEENGKEVTETAAMPTIPFAKDATPSPPSQPDPASPQSDTAEVPVQDANPPGSVGIQPLPLPTSTTSIPPFQQEEVSKSQSALEPKFLPAEGGRPEEDEEKAGPSGLNVHSDSIFIPFSGGGQRLGGPGAGAMGPSLSSYSSASSSLSTLTAAVESPKAKKAKSSHGSSTKVSTVTTPAVHKKILTICCRIITYDHRF